MGRRPLGDLSVMLVTLPPPAGFAVAGNGGRTISLHEPMALNQIGMRIASRMIPGCNANQRAVRVSERTRIYSR